MVFTDQDVKQLLQEALQRAQLKPDKGEIVRAINKNRSQYWVEALAEQFKKSYEGDSEIRIFTKSDDSNQKDFGLNELLYDILVCRVGEVESSIHKKKLCFIKEVLWQVESEFAHNTRNALIDFNKLDFRGFGRATITTDEFTPEELQILRAFEWDRINFKDADKTAKIARMNGLTLDELEAWRVSTRRGLGVKVRYKEE